MQNRSEGRTPSRTTARAATNQGARSGGRGLRLFGPRAPGGPALGGGPAGGFAETWMSRLLIGGAVLLLIILFPLQWLHTPTLAVRANVNTFAPRPGGLDQNAPGGADGAVTASYDLSEEATISAQVYDGTGTVVKTLLANTSESAGPHFIRWDGSTDNGGVATDGSYRIQITAHGAASANSGSVTVTVDTTPPALKLVNLQDGQKLKSADLVVQGVTEPGATVQFADGGPSLTADSSGGFTLHRQLAHGPNSFQVLARDASGNTSTVSRSVDLLDRPPAVKLDSPADGAWTNQKVLTVAGAVDPGSTVRVNNQDAQAGPDGRFHTDIVLDEGANAVTVEATDPVGNKTQIQEHVNLDTRPPAVQIDSLAEGATVHEAQVHVYGRTDPGVKLSVGGQQVAVDSQGHFDTAVDLVVGDNTIHVEAQDPAGNLATLDRKVRYDLATSTFPDLPITGTATALAVIILAWVLFGGWFSSVSLKLATDRPALQPGRAGYGPSERLLITYTLSKRARTSIQVLDGAGRAVATLLSPGARGGGEHQVLWDGTGAEGVPLPAGPYRIQAQARTVTSTVSASAPVTVLGGSARSTLDVGAGDTWARPSGPPPAPPARTTYGPSTRTSLPGREPPAPPERNVLRGDRG